MAKKLPKIFKKPIKENLFNKKILRYIEQKTDKEFLQNSFELKDGFFQIRQLGETKEDAVKLQKLTALAKDIKNNQALPVNFIPMAGVGILVAGAFFFFTVFMNPILERVIENALQNVFEAKVDIRKFELNPLRFRIGFNSITIADADAPMTNLFEMHKTEIRLLPQAVLRGKIYIEEVRADSIQFGTPRTSSGAIFTDEQLQKKREAPPKKSAPPLVDLQNFDAMALITGQYDKLSSPKLYEEVLGFYRTAEEKWTSQIEISKEKIASLQTNAEPFIKFDINSIDVSNPQSISTVLKLIEDGKTLVNSIQDASAQANAIVSGVDADVRSAASLLQNAQNGINADLDYLKSFLDLSNGPYKDILNAALQQILTNSAQQYIGYAQRGLIVMNKLSAYQKEQANAKPKKVVFKGRDVQFPSVAYPKFYLGIFASDFTINNWKSAFDLRDVSSHPNITARPTTLKINIDEVGGAQKSFAANALADFRDSTADLFDAKITGQNIPVSLQKDLVSLGEIGIGGFNGNLKFLASSSGKKSGSFSIGGDLALVDSAIINPSGTLGNALDEAIREAGYVNIGFDMHHNVSKNDEFSVNSNIFSLVQAALKKAALQYLKQAQAELEKALKGYIEQFLKDKNISGAQLEQIFSLAKGDKTAITALQTEFQSKLAAMEEKAKGGMNEKIDETKQAVDNAVSEAKAQAEAEAARIRQQAEDEAKQKAADAAKNILGGKKLF